MSYNWSFAFLKSDWPMYLDGLKYTLGLAAIGVLIGVVLGIVLGMMRLSKIAPFRWIATAYIEFIRGTPLLVQVFFFYYGLPLLFGIKGGDNFLTGALALGINSGAYVAEIMRAGIQAVDIGQMEAARSLGMSHSTSMMRIVLPQAIRNILPALGNEFVVVIKESSIVSVIGVTELMKKTNNIMTSRNRYFESLLIVAVLYFVLTFVLSKLLGVAERRMGRSRRGGDPKGRENDALQESQGR